MFKVSVWASCLNRILPSWTQIYVNSIRNEGSGNDTRQWSHTLNPKKAAIPCDSYWLAPSHYSLSGARIFVSLYITSWGVQGFADVALRRLFTKWNFYYRVLSFLDGCFGFLWLKRFLYQAYRCILFCFNETVSQGLTVSWFRAMSYHLRANSRSCTWWPVRVDGGPRSDRSRSEIKEAVRVLRAELLRLHCNGRTVLLCTMNPLISLNELELLCDSKNCFQCNGVRLPSSAKLLLLLAGHRGGGTWVHFTWKVRTVSATEKWSKDYT